MRFLIFLHICFLLKIPFATAQEDKKLLYEGNKAYEKKEFTEAEKHYREAQTKPKTGIESYFNLGDALYEQGKYDEAAKEFDKVLNQAKNNEAKAAAYHNLGNSMLKANKLDESINAYKQSLRYKPGQQDAQYNLSYALKKKQKQEQKKQEQDQKQQPQEDQKDQDKKDDQNPQPQQPKDNGMSKEEAERILNGINNKEQNLRKRMYDKGNNPGQSYEPKPW